MPDTIIQSGSFVSTGVAQTIQLRQGVDWMTVYNATRFATNASKVKFYWQKGMSVGSGLAEGLAGGVWTPTILVNPVGFTVVDSSIISASASSAVTGITAANPPVVTSALSVNPGDIVRLSNLNHMFNIAGMDFTVTAVAGGTFTIGNITLDNLTAATAGNAVRINYDARYYPRRRNVTYVRNSAQAVIFLSVTHGYTVGQKVTLEFPGGSRVWGQYAAMDGITVTILAINVARAANGGTANEPTNALGDNNIQVDFDASGFTTWDDSFGQADQEWPSDNKYPISPATVVPVGEDTATALGLNPLVVPQIAAGNILADATYNTSYIGMILGTDSANPELSPSGATGNVMYWVAGKSFATQP